MAQPWSNEQRAKFKETMRQKREKGEIKPREKKAKRGQEFPLAVIPDRPAPAASRNVTGVSRQPPLEIRFGDLILTIRRAQ